MAKKRNLSGPEEVDSDVFGVVLAVVLVDDDFVLNAMKEIGNFDGGRWRIDAGMFPPMKHHGRALREALSTNITNVRSFADVSKKMDFLGAQASEGFSTNSA